MIRRWLAVIVMMVSAVLPFLPAGEAAAFAGRAQFHGYFSNTYDDEGSFVFSSGIYPTAAPLYNGKPYTANFISQVLGHLAGAPGRNKTGAEFIIDTMLGYNAGTAQGTRANALNAATINTWVNAVHTYSDNGWIQWSVSSSWSVNTYWQGNNGGGTDPDDDSWYNEVGSTTQAIIFHQPATANYYVIKQNCANPIGNLAGLNLTPPDYNVLLTTQAVTSENGFSPYTVVSGKTYTMNAQVFNQLGPGPSEAGRIEVMMPAAGVCTPGPGCASSQSMVPAAYATGMGFQGSSAPPYPAGANWYWNVVSLPVGDGPHGVLNFTVNGAVGTTFNLDAYYYKANRAGAVAFARLTYRIVSQATPAVVGANGDIQAGGGVCGGTLTTGAVKGYPAAGSNGQYVVSASAVGGIGDFGSNGAASGSAADKLRLGQNGGYAMVCRPDLLTAANDYRGAGGTDYGTIGAAQAPNLDVATLTAHPVYFYDGVGPGAKLHLHGVVSQKLTIVATAGTVVIDNPITLNNATFGSHVVPSLGIIAVGDIDVNAAVTRVDAYLFANGTIDTCTEASSVCATPALVINGFVMAKTLAFHRLGPANTNGAVVAERVVLNPQIYLNPPKLFDSSVDDLLLEGQGEKQPLF